MKKVLIAGVGIILVSILAMSFAEEPEQTEDVMGQIGKDVPGTTQGGTSEGQMMRMCPMHHTMMGSMMSKAIAPTEDGGVIVLAGDKLIKYDKDLTLVKEVKIEMDMEGMQKKMSQMMEKCPLYKKEMKKKGSWRWPK
ncbi:MAG: hypothetical protein ACYSSL_05130 [Planctomycetota bacterium]|jgi:hypothetical protein